MKPGDPKRNTARPEGTIELFCLFPNDALLIHYRPGCFRGSLRERSSKNPILLCKVLNKRSRRTVTTGDFSFCLERMYNWIGGSIFKPVILLRIVKPLGMPSGVRIVTPSPASTAAQVPERLGLVKVRRHGRSPRFSNAAERKAHGASNSTSFNSWSGSGGCFQIQTIGTFPIDSAVNASPGSADPNMRTKSSPVVAAR
jgi:hypothetical protein